MAAVRPRGARARARGWECGPERATARVFLCFAGTFALASSIVEGDEIIIPLGVVDLERIHLVAGFDKQGM